jgi:DNA repair exonuclease SbcCD ATPase subunit
MSDEIGAQCGLGEGTHYGCECVMRRIADLERALSASEARAHAAEEHSRGLESALQIMGEENAKIERERDALKSWQENATTLLIQREDRAAAAEARREEAERRVKAAADHLGRLADLRQRRVSTFREAYAHAQEIVLAALSGAGAEEGR